MHPQRCVCPKCGITLRVKERTYLGRPIPCPECQTPLILTIVDDDQLRVALAELPASPVVASRPVVERSPSFAVVWNQRLRGWFGNVTVISWGATLLVAAMIIALVVRPKPSRHPIAASKSPDFAAAVTDEPDSQMAVVLEPENSEVTEPALSTTEEADRPENQPEQPSVSTPVNPGSTMADDAPIDAQLVPESPAANQKAPVVTVAEPPPIDFDAAFEQPLKQFRQIRAIPRKDLLDLVAELLGAPIRYDREMLGESGAALEQTLAFELTETTVGRVLDKTLEKSGLTYDRERDGLRLRRTDDPVPDSAIRKN